MTVRKRPSPWHLCLLLPVVLAVAHCGLDSSFAGDGFNDDAGIPRDARTSEGGLDGQADRITPPPRGLVATQVVTGDAHSCAIDAPAGDVYCWGSNEYGQLGQPLDLGAVSIPRRVELPTGVRASRLAAGSWHTCALTDRKGVICWGRNDVGQLGRAPSASAPPESIVPPSALATASFVAIAAGRAHTCAIYIQPRVSDAGAVDAGAPEDVLRVACWGDNASSQLARDDVASTELPADVRRGGNPVVARLLSLGADFSVASLRVGDGDRVQSWGSAARGELGTDPDAGASALPTSVLLADGGALENVVALQAGTSHSCAALLVDVVTDAGDLSDAGDVDAEVLDADVADASAPDGGPDDAGAADASDAGGDRELQLFCWGANESGQLVRDVATERERPARTSSVQSARSELVVGGRVTCLIDDFSLRCAGANEEGQLGIGSADSEPHPTFTPVHGIDLPVVGASLGARHGCVLLQTIPGVAQVACWGDNTQGQLGDAVGLGGGYVDAAPEARHRRTTPVFVAPPD